MGQIHVHEFISLDGVNESPSWTFDYGFDEEMGADLGKVTDGSEAILLGRNTFEMFAPAWSTRTAEDDPGVPFFNDTPKHVVSSTLEEAEGWQNSSILGPYDPEAIRGLKQRTEGNVFTSGSTELVRAMLVDGLVDELHLCMFPVALGSGKKLFAEGGPDTRLALKTTRSYANGVVWLTYVPA